MRNFGEPGYQNNFYPRGSPKDSQSADPFGVWELHVTSFLMRVIFRVFAPRCFTYLPFCCLASSCLGLRVAYYGIATMRALSAELRALRSLPFKPRTVGALSECLRNKSRHSRSSLLRAPTGYGLSVIHYGKRAY